MKRFFPSTLGFIFSVFITGIFFFTFFRLLLTVTNLGAVQKIPGATSVMLQSMLMGLRFDTVISGYILALPALVLIVAELLNIVTRKLYLIFTIYLSVFYTLSFFICSADVPFFNNYNNRLNITILNWTASPLFMTKLIWQDKVLLSYFILFIVVAIVFLLRLKAIYRSYIRLIPTVQQQLRTNKALKLALSLIFLGLMLLGIRGRIDEKSPITVGTAYFCSYDFPNQAGLNPVYTFMRSWMDGMKGANKKLHLMDDAEALNNSQQYLEIPKNSTSKDYPMEREVSGIRPAQGCNVVLVIMESMSACYLNRYGNSDHLTPNLDSLNDAANFSFDNFYSAGIHTFNGIFSTLYSFPALLAKHTMAGFPIPSYTGLPYFARSRGYETIFFMTHDDQFDNIGGFLTANSVNKIISKKDYPASQVKSTLGVPDHNMFDFSIPLLNKYYEQKKPFLAMYMTTSNHDPYIIPDNIPFTPKHTEVRGGCVEYADWAIGRFLQTAAKQPWFNNTIFVFTGDHGALYSGTYGDLPLSFNHVPCIIYAPMAKNKPQRINSPGGQIDLFPTIAGLMGGNYTNNTMGIDLLNNKRKYMYFSQDDKVGVADSAELYVWHTNEDEKLFNIFNKTEISPIKRSKADTMKKYAFSMIQVSQWLLQNEKTGHK